MLSGRCSARFQHFYQSFSHLKIITCPYSSTSFRRAVYRGQLKHARTAYESLPSSPLDRNLLQRLIILARNGRTRQDLEFLKRIIEELPNRFHQTLTPFEYNALIYAYGVHQMPEKAQRLLEEMKKSGVQPNLYTYNILLNSYKSCGHLASAERLVEEMKASGIEPDTVTYNTMLHLWLQTGHTDRMFEFYETAVSDSWADVYTYSVILGAAIPLNPRVANQIFETLMRRNDLDTAAMNTMLRYQGSSLEKTLDLYYSLQEKCRPDLKTFNILLDICLKHGNAARASMIYQDMKKKKIQPDIVTYGTLIGSEDLKGALDLFDEMVRKMKPTRRIVNSMVNAAKGARVPELNRLLMTLKPYESLLDTIGHNTLMGALAQHGQSAQVQTIYDRVFRYDQRPDVATMTHLVLAYVNDNHIEDALEIYHVLREHHRGERPKIKLDATFFSTLITSLSSIQSPHDSEERLLAALTLFNDMRPLGIQPSVHTYTAMLHACGQYRDGYVLEHVHGLIKVDLYLDPDIAIYNALMDAYNRTGDGQTVLDIWQQLTVSSEVVIDPATVSIVFDSCGHNGYQDRAQSIWRWLKHTGFRLNTNNYNSFIECLCRIPGRDGWDKALELVKNEMSRPGRRRPGYPEIEPKTINTLRSFAKKKGLDVEKDLLK